MENKKQPNPKTPNFEWLVHIGEDFVAEGVMSPNAEGAIMLAFAKYYEENKNAGISLSYDISVINVTLYNAQHSANQILQKEREKRKS